MTPDKNKNHLSWKDYGCGSIDLNDLKNLSQYSQQKFENIFEKFFDIAKENNQYIDSWLNLPTLYKGDCKNIETL